MNGRNFLLEIDAESESSFVSTPIPISPYDHCSSFKNNRQNNWLSLSKLVKSPSLLNSNTGAHSFDCFWEIQLKKVLLFVFWSIISMDRTNNIFKFIKSLRHKLEQVVIQILFKSLVFPSNMNLDRLQLNESILIFFRIPIFNKQAHRMLKWFFLLLESQ